jgi:hypothetical protein
VNCSGFIIGNGERPTMLKRHWVATVLAVWMFADALLMLLWETQQRYSVWELRHRPRMPHPSIWLNAITDNLWGLLNLLPAPHLLFVLREAVLFHLLHLRRTPSLMQGSLLNFAVFGISVAMGYGLLRMRQWARWGYAGLCVLSLMLSIFLGWAASFHPLVAIFRLIGLILPIVLLIFLFRRGLVAPPRGGPLIPNRSQ